MEVKETKIVSIHDVINVLEEGKGSELTYEQQLALQHAKKFGTKAKTSALKKELEGTGMLTEKSIVKIIEIMPKNSMTLRQILAPERKSFSDEDIAKIQAIIKDKGN